MMLSRLSMAFVGAVLAALLVLIVLSATSSVSNSPPTAGAAPTTAATPFPTDDRGFVNTAARCDGTQTAIAIGRTDRSLVVICTDPAGTLGSGALTYRGVRISDGAALTLPATTAGDGQFVARGDHVTYLVSAKDLLVTSDDTVLRREPMVTYQQPRYSAEAR
jgi:hypothetical protein